MNKIIKTSKLFFVCLMMLSVQSCFKEDINESIGFHNEEASLFVVRNVWKGKEVKLNKDLLGGAKYTSGVVISNHENKNLPKGHIAIENEWRGEVRGILLELDDLSDYHFGDSVFVDLEGALMSRKNGPLTISGITKENVQVLSRNKRKEHRPVSISALMENPDKFESTLVSITADVDDIQAGATIEGRNRLNDGVGEVLDMITLAEASFKDMAIAPNASFKGIPLKETASDKLTLYLQKKEDMTNPSGKIYSGWPETFEEPSHEKGSYDMPDIYNNVGLPTGEWHLYYSIFGNTAGRDRIVSGQNAIRMQQNRNHDVYLQMNFDVPDGAGKVTFWYGSYYNDQSSTFKLEYSIDQGQTWQQIGESISDAHTQAQSSSPKQAVFLMDIDQPVRFRINKLGLGASSPTVNNGRLGIDDFAVYKNY